MIRKTRAATASVSGNLRRDRRRTDLGKQFAVDISSKGGKRTSQTRGRHTPVALESGRNNPSPQKGVSSAGLKPASEQRQLHTAARESMKHSAAKASSKGRDDGVNPPLPTAALSAGRSIHESGDWRIRGTSHRGSGERAERPVDYANRILTSMPHRDVLKLYHEKSADYLERATNPNSKRARGDAGLFAAVARLKAEHGEGWLAQRLADNLASFLRAFPDRAPALKGRDRRLRTTLVVGVKSEGVPTPRGSKMAGAKASKDKGRSSASGKRKTVSEIDGHPPRAAPNKKSRAAAEGETAAEDDDVDGDDDEGPGDDDGEARSTGDGSGGTDASAGGGADFPSFRSKDRSRKKKTPSSGLEPLPGTSLSPAAARRKAQRQKAAKARREGRRQSTLVPVATPLQAPPSAPALAAPAPHEGLAVVPAGLAGGVAAGYQVPPSARGDLQAVRPLSVSVQTLQLQLRAAERRAALSEARAAAAERMLAEIHEVMTRPVGVPTSVGAHGMPGMTGQPGFLLGM